MYGQLDTHTSHKVSRVAPGAPPLLALLCFYSSSPGLSDAGRFHFTKQPHSSDSVRFANNAAISQQNNMTSLIK